MFRRTRRPRTSRVLVAAVLSGLVAGIAPPAAAAPGGRLDVLVYSATYGFRHDSIDAATERFAQLGDSREFDVDLTVDPADITGATLADYDVVVFNNTTGEHPFSERQQREFVDWVSDGGGFVGIHSAADSNYYWPEFGKILGAYFSAHPHTGEAVNVTEASDSPLVSHLPRRLELNEEYYRWQLDPRPNVKVLTSLDTSTTGPWQPSYHENQPTTWCSEPGQGRSFYTGWGHFGASFDDPRVWETLVQGLRWAGGRLNADCSPSQPQADRLQAENADAIAFGTVATHTGEGAAATVSKTRHDGYLVFEDVDLTGVDAFEFRVSPETAPQPRPYHPVIPAPAAGGTIHLRLDNVVNAGNRTDSCPFAGQCYEGQDIASVTVDPGRPDWHTLRADVDEVKGVHDLVLVYSEQVAQSLGGSRIIAPEATDEHYLFSVDWVRPVPATTPPTSGE